MPSKSKFVKLFLKQFLDIGSSTGSLIAEIIGLFRTFQRLSAPSQFKAKFSHEFIEMFRWATDIFKIISSYIQTNPLSDFELFNVYNLILPLTILMFISTLAGQAHLILCYFVYGTCLVLGMGFGFITIDDDIVIGCIIVGVIAFAFGIFIICGFNDDDNNFCKFFKVCKCKKSKRKEMNESDFALSNINTVILSVFISCLVFSALIYPIVKSRYKMQLIILCVIGIICIIGICLSFVLHNVSEIFIQNALMKIISFVFTCYSLLIIPATDQFVILIKNEYRKKWPIYPVYVVVALFIPISMTLIQVILNHPEIAKKYSEPRGCCNYIYFELIDIIRQVAYAILAAYDILWGCLGIEVVWIILVLSIRPFPDASNYTLAIGNSVIILISNGIMIYSSYHETEQFSFAVTVICIIFACIPAVVSIYLYFIKDFYFEDDNTEINEDFQRSINITSLYVLFITSLSWLFYGTCIPFLLDSRMLVSYK